MIINDGKYNSMAVRRSLYNEAKTAQHKIPDSQQRNQSTRKTKTPKPLFNQLMTMKLCHVTMTCTELNSGRCPWFGSIE